MPRASIALAIVLAVYIPPHAPEREQCRWWTNRGCHGIPVIKCSAMVECIGLCPTAPVGSAPGPGQELRTMSHRCSSVMRPAV